ncbi:MAG: hypothetical protein ABWX68_05570 [Arthrobacter sp.]|uniref:hypothetical protein n=1 Tax=Arthrobacter sp. TaxID=1667 RepID=UPI00346EA6A0
MSAKDPVVQKKIRPAVFRPVSTVLEAASPASPLVASVPSATATITTGSTMENRSRSSRKVVGVERGADEVQGTAGVVRIGSPKSLRADRSARTGSSPPSARESSVSAIAAASSRSTSARWAAGTPRETTAM